MGTIVSSLGVCTMLEKHAEDWKVLDNILRHQRCALDV